MAKKLTITPEMQKAIDILQEYGCICRYPGGFWARPEAEMARSTSGPASQHYSYPEGIWVGHGTLEALARRGLIQVADQAISRFGAFPIKYTKS